mmetsp:Transcript_42891/g.84273  ORF Transcript_42891/g.84273 Transcript_42891/m.84273 type:complete len:215 (-) Transcript_42891:43-687(-)|eukprot:CAMPEP_0194343394 /NCGR_PEP_ID=MMETSP0171-20130528/96842_1 /TAXON_ID=218684 /ORGANISM="Corethron pennatum, Strain L29A3" /LENGTH=214 /DNA_ID=CAMNT_0039109589 /DNA_START=196 /DNA_END=840 /DNA_ORIENTATION=+
MYVGMGQQLRVEPLVLFAEAQVDLLLEVGFAGKFDLLIVAHGQKQVNRVPARDVEFQRPVPLAEGVRPEFSTDLIRNVVTVLKAHLNHHGRDEVAVVKNILPLPVYFAAGIVVVEHASAPFLCQRDSRVSRVPFLFQERVDDIEVVRESLVPAYPLVTHCELPVDRGASCFGHVQETVDDRIRLSTSAASGRDAAIREMISKIGIRVRISVGRN